MHIRTGQGDHVGYITSTGCDGLFWHTCQAYLKTDNAQSQEDKYCVNDQAILHQLDNYAQQKVRVVISFETYNGWAKGCYEMRDVITGVRPA